MDNPDIQNTIQTLELLKVPDNKRDSAWLDNFVNQMMDAPFASPDPQVKVGLDGFPYFAFVTPTGKEEESFTVRHVLNHCTEKGLGVSVNEEKYPPDWLFSYGDLVALRCYGSIQGDADDESKEASDSGIEKIEVAEGQEVLCSFPSESYIPNYARDVIRKQLQQLEINEPKVFLMFNPSLTPAKNLVFNVFPEDLEDEDDLQDYLAAISWYLPQSHGLIAISKTSPLVQSFQAF